MKTVLCFIFSLAALWVGCYFLGLMHYSDWRIGPTFVTMVVSIAAGVVGVFVSLQK